MKTYVQLQILKELLTNYRYPEPFHVYLKKFLRKKPGAGSRDRRQIREIAFNYFRPGRSLQGVETDERILLSHFLGVSGPDALLQDWLEDKTGLQPADAALSPTEKIRLVREKHESFKPDQIFPLTDRLSNMTDTTAFVNSHFLRPEVHIFITGDHREAVTKELSEKNISFREISNQVLSMPPETALNNLETSQQGFFEVMDYSTVLAGMEFLPKKGEKWWDCCAGSGGKSLILKEQEAEIELWATDLRRSMLNNYSQRMKSAGHIADKVLHADLTKSLRGEFPKFDGIIWDAPCSGSGTWARHPEHLLYFHKDKLNSYCNIQEKMIRNILPYLKPGGRLFYITCSVYKTENEGLLQKLEARQELSLISSKLLEGYNSGRNSLFVAELLKSGTDG